MTKTLTAALAIGFLAASCGPADEGTPDENGVAGVTVDENGAVVATADETTSTAEQTLCSGWGTWARYPKYGGCSCGAATAWATTAATPGGTVDNGASGWTKGTNHTGKERRVQAQCSRRIDGRKVTVTGGWTKTSSNIHVNCPAGYPDVWQARCEIR